MLERKAASLEPCHLKRVLPNPTSSSVRSRRRLHTGFWQHGAAAFELSGSWPTDLRAPSQSMGAAGDAVVYASIPDGLSASTFLLDFLYPQGAVAFLRRVSSGLTERQELSMALPRSPRLFSSSAAARETVQASRIRPRSDVTLVNHESFLAYLEPREGVNVGKPKTISSPQHARNSTVATNPLNELDSPPPVPQSLDDLIRRDDAEAFEEAWYLYNELDGDKRQEAHADLLRHLARSRNPRDLERICLTMRRMNSSLWTNETMGVAIAASLRMGYIQRAVEFFTVGLQERSLVGGLDELLAHAFSTKSWQLLKEVWLPYFSAASQNSSLNIKHLPNMSAVSSLATSIAFFRRQLDAERASLESPNRSRKDGPPTDGLNNLPALEIILEKASRRALEQPCKPGEAISLLAALDSPAWYDRYLTVAFKDGHRQALVPIYRIYRGLNGVNVTRRVLHKMFEIFYPEDVGGLEQVYEDYMRAYQSLDIWGYRKFLKFYANRGDVKSVDRLWDSLLSTHKKHKVQRDIGLFNQILNVYAERGEVDEVRRRFNEISHKYGLTPDVASWNTVLKALVKARQYDEAVKWFEELRSAIGADEWSYATIMNMSGPRGDLNYVLELLEDVKSQHLEVRSAMLEAVVEAYCQNDMLGAAERTCRSAEGQFKTSPNDLRRMWNVVLNRHGLRRDLDAVWRVLRRMSRLRLSWHQSTHEILLRAFSLAGQSHYAYRLLRVAYQKRAFPLTADHFTVVMAGAARAKNWNLVVAAREWMRQVGVPTSAAALVHANEAERHVGSQAGPGLLTEGDEEYGARELGGKIIAHYRRMLTTSVHESESALDAKSMGLSPVDTAEHQPANLHLWYQHPESMHSAILMLLRTKDFKSVQELKNMLAEQLPSYDPSQPDESLPVPLLSMVMAIEYDQGNLARVKLIWDSVWEKTLAVSRSSRSKDGVILAGHRYHLCPASKVLLKALRDEKDGQAIVDLIERITSAGFRLDSNTWNHTVQNLLQLGYWREAITFCEDMLMPGFTGWKQERVWKEIKHNISLRQRQMGAAPRHLRPTSYTLTVLIADFKQIREQALWNAQAAARLQFMEARCPKLVRALLSMRYTGNEIEKKLLGEKGENWESFEPIIRS